jgi:hypothetical protein
LVQGTPTKSCLCLSIDAYVAIGGIDGVCNSGGLWWQIDECMT